ncbi:MAG TPA: hypothetical protein VMV33_17490 [Rhodocyclaceae bacterium]|nr:hypothetical protein [Rhodocyclaceae bacterium]
MPGEIAEMMLDGTLCQDCGQYMGEDAGLGFPVSCGCNGESSDYECDAPEPTKKRPAGTYQCHDCNRRPFTTKRGLHDHQMQKHRVQCRTCKKYFRTDDALTMHAVMAHGAPAA